MKQKKTVTNSQLVRIREWYRSKRDAPKRRQLVILRRFFYASIILLAVFSYITNPFVKFSIVTDPFKDVSFENNEFVITNNHQIVVKNDPFYTQLVFLKAGWHIAVNTFSGSPKAKKSTVDEIIAEIHELRFNPDQPFLISGDHFSMLYPRSLGIFYHSLLDPRTALDEEDWNNRQKIYLKTTAYALQVFQQSKRLSTTIVPAGPRSVALMNISAYPSDTLYSLLYALTVMSDTKTLFNQYIYEADGYQPSLATQTASAQLLESYRQSLRDHYAAYKEYVFDEPTGLIKRTVLLSGTKDTAKRQSAFYDNVIFWKTTKLAQELQIIPRDEQFLSDLKQRILLTYWKEKQGCFKEDLDPRQTDTTFYSSDWLIAYMTGFLDLEQPAELNYIERCVAYIQRNALDQPFGLQYHPDPRTYQLVGFIKYFVPSYGSTTIWSNWGMEYIKALTNLYQKTGDRTYLEEASRQLGAYSYNIKRYRGYPEVYNSQGDFFRQGPYKSVRQTGWVVSYEQAAKMLEWTKIESAKEPVENPHKW